jgi:hypothetical protein
MKPNRNALRTLAVLGILSGNYSINSDTAEAQESSGCLTCRGGMFQYCAEAEPLSGYDFCYTPPDMSWCMEHTPCYMITAK